MAFIGGFRTDLASEAHRLWQSEPGKLSALSGVIAGEERLEGLPVTAVRILDEEGARALGKPVGQYFTLELERIPARGDAVFTAAAKALAALILRCLEGRVPSSALVAALGNPDITPDAIGPLTASSILVTRHLKARQPSLFGAFGSVSLCRTGVLGTSGVESASQILALCRQVEPDCVIAVDALAGAEPERLCRTLQVCSSGIAPGSGVGNDRAPLDRDTLGLPVVALGVPTVIDASRFSEEESLRGLFVTPREIDETVRRAGRLLGYGIDLALHPGLEPETLDLYLA